MNTLPEFVAEFHKLSERLDKGLSFLREQTIEFAAAEDEYRVKHAEAFLTAEGSSPMRKAYADKATSQQRRRAHLADGMRQAALEAVRSRRTQISALQSLLAAWRSEADLTKYGPSAA